MLCSAVLLTPGRSDPVGSESEPQEVHAVGVQQEASYENHCSTKLKARTAGGSAAARCQSGAVSCSGELSQESAAASGHMRARVSFRSCRNDFIVSIELCEPNVTAILCIWRNLVRKCRQYAPSRGLCRTYSRRGAAPETVARPSRLPRSRRNAFYFRPLCRCSENWMTRTLRTLNLAVINDTK